MGGGRGRRHGPPTRGTPSRAGAKGRAHIAPGPQEEVPDGGHVSVPDFASHWTLALPRLGIVPNFNSMNWAKF